MTHAMNEEMDRQVPLMDESNTKVDKATSDLKNTNVKLEDIFNEVIEPQLCSLCCINGFVCETKGSDGRQSSVSIHMLLDMIKSCGFVPAEVVITSALTPYCCA